MAISFFCRNYNLLLIITDSAVYDNHALRQFWFQITARGFFFLGADDGSMLFRFLHSKSSLWTRLVLVGKLL